MPRCVLQQLARYPSDRAAIEALIGSVVEKERGIPGLESNHRTGGERKETCSARRSPVQAASQNVSSFGWVSSFSLNA